MVLGRPWPSRAWSLLLLALLCLCSTAGGTPPTPAAAAATSDSDSDSDVLAGFDDQASLSKLLHWSLQQTDLDALHERAESIRSGGAAARPGVLSAEGNVGDHQPAAAAALPAGTGAPPSGDAPSQSRESFASRAADLSELYGQLMPNAVELMRTALERSENSSAPVSEREAALLELQASSQRIYIDACMHATHTGARGGAPRTAGEQQQRRRRQGSKPAISQPRTGVAFFTYARAYIRMRPTQELAEDLDHAKDLQTIGGYPRLLSHLRSKSDGLVSAAAWVVGTVVKNQRELQLAMLEEGAMGLLVHIISWADSPEAVGKALYALAALLRNCAEAQAAFFSSADAEHAVRARHTMRRMHARTCMHAVGYTVWAACRSARCCARPPTRTSSARLSPSSPTSSAKQRTRAGATEARTARTIWRRTISPREMAISPAEMARPRGAGCPTVGGRARLSSWTRWEAWRAGAAARRGATAAWCARQRWPLSRARGRA